MNKSISIILSADDNYVPYLYICLQSLIEHTNAQLNYYVYILNTNISEENKQNIKSLEKINIKIKFIDISNFINEYNKKLFSINLHFTIETYYRFFVPEIFSSLDKVIYIDCDMLVLKDVAELYNINIKDNYIGATRDLEIVRAGNIVGKKYTDYFYNILKLKDHKNYIQAGCLIMNLAKMREDNITEKLINTLKLIEKPKFVDQCIINMVCEDKIFFIPQNWNFTWHLSIIDDNYYTNLQYPYNDEYKGAKDNPFIIHFTGTNLKPENYPKLKEAQLFWNYAKNSPYFSIHKKKIEKAIKLDELKIKRLKKKVRKCFFINILTLKFFNKKYILKINKLQNQLQELKNKWI